MSKKNTEITRRNFVSTTSTVGAGAITFGVHCIPQSSFGANDRLQLGIVGAGSRGKALMAWAHKLETSHNVQFTAVCDIWNQRRNAAAKKVSRWNGKSVATYRTLDDLCSKKDTDVLLIATADFQHCYHAAKAVQAGKDVYVEKPFGCDFEQIKKAYLAIRATDRIVQMGTQSRGNGKYYHAKESIQKGLLGKITYGEIHECISNRQWRIKGAENSIRQEDTDWREFLAYLDPERYPWNPRHYREFRLFWPFSSGCFCQRLSHRIDLVNLVLDSVPQYAVALGGVYLWNDGRTNPDTVQCLLEYPGKTLITYHLRMGNAPDKRGINLFGTNGMLDLDRGIIKVNDKREEIDQEISLQSVPSIDHMGHFFECVRTREQPRANVEAGFAHTAATAMVNMAYRTGCRMEYDPDLLEIRPSLKG